MNGDDDPQCEEIDEEEQRNDATGVHFGLQPAQMSWARGSEGRMGLLQVDINVKRGT
jgi:hypothetical protein